MAEIPEALDALLHQLTGEIHSALARHTENRHLGVMLRAEFVQITQGQDGNAAHLLADEVGVDIKDAEQPVAVGVAADEAGHRRTQTAGTDQNGRQLFAVTKEQIADLSAQHIHLVADALLAEAAEAVEVLPHLTGGGAHHVGQLTGGDLVLSVSGQIGQITIIFGQPLDDRKRHLILDSHDRIPLICIYLITYYKMRRVSCQFFV